jgi:RNA-binding protein
LPSSRGLLRSCRSKEECATRAHVPTLLPEEAPILPLTPRRRAALKSLAHDLKPVLQIGKGGLTPAAVDAVREALAARELIKVKVLDAAPEPARAAGEALVAELGDAQLVQVIGRTVVLYRRHPDRPRIELPD